MRTRDLYIVLGLLMILLAGFGFYAGWTVSRPAEYTRNVDAQVILTALRDRGFLVTQTYIFDQPVTIEKTSGSAFKDFFFGQTITARGAMEVNMGIDLANVSAEDVVIADDVITIKIPGATLFNVRLVGPIEVQNQQGILKRLLQSQDGYNEALNELSKIAEETATQEEFVARATDRAKEEVRQMLGYVAEGKNINVEIK
ncbi:MAG: DUF4230 domain-containing protein [Patescibacteria group bacterium]|nr:DUF4230 domain-containing protein [Patescibacteria group bacterium]